MKTTGRSRPEQRDWPLPKMALGQFGLDGPLTFAQPVHGRVDLVGADPFKTEIGHQGGVAPPLGRGQLRAGMHDPGEDQRVGDVALFARRPQQLGQTQRLRHDTDRGHMTVRQRTGQLQPRPATTSVSPANAARNASRAGAGKAETLPSVSWRILPSERKLRRNRCETDWRSSPSFV
jgi:hypothetical protein